VAKETELLGVIGSYPELIKVKNYPRGTFVVLMRKALKQAQNHMKHHMDSAAALPGWVLE